MNLAVDSADKLTELLWQDALRHLGSTNNEVLLPVNVTEMIGHDNVNKIKTRLRALIGAPVVAFVDETINALRVMRTPSFSGSSVSVASHGKLNSFKREATEPSAKSNGRIMPAKPPKVPRPPNAFILYRQHHHPSVKGAYPSLSNNEISIIIGKQWKAETESVKMQFRNMAEDLKKKHAEEHPDYHYTPRKPSEKKRRAPSRQHAKPAQQLPTPSDTTSSTPGMHDAAMPTTTSPPTAAVASPSASPTGLEGLDFDTDIFGQLVQQVQGDFNFGAGGSFSAFGVPPSESFEFSDYVTDCY